MNYEMLSKNQKRRLRKALKKSGIQHAAGEALKSMHIGRSAGAAFGSLAGPAGSLIASKVGGMVDRAVNKKLLGSGTYMTGRGAYMTGRGTYKSNATMAGGNGHLRHPNLSSTSRNAETGEITIARREYIGSVNATGSSDFSVDSYSVNPGLPAVFKWLSQLAANYTEYHMIQLVYTYESVISPMSVSSVGSLGTIVLAANYNAGSDKFATFTQMIEYSGSVRGKISTDIKCGIECDPSQNSNDSDLYIRSGAVPVNQDIKTYDLAKFQIGMFGVPTEYTAGTQLGLLWADYKVVLRKPRLYTALGYSIMFDTFFSNGSMSSIDPLGTDVKKATNSSINGTWLIAADAPGNVSSRYVFPDDFAGTVQIMYYVMGTGLEATSADVTPAGHVVVSRGMISDGGANLAANSASAISASVSHDAQRCFNLWTFDVTVTNVANSNYIDVAWTRQSSLSVGTFSVYMVNPLSINPVTNAVDA